MKLSDYVVEFFIEHEIIDFFGYQGTMIAHFVDSICKNNKTRNHSCYNEQGAAFAACGFASSTDKCAVAYSTSGPGAINLISGIANAYYDSIPVIFITGQANTYEYYDNIPKIRQHTFQELNIVDMVKNITKYAVMVKQPEKIRYEIEKAWHIANSGRKGPVLIDLPMNIQRSEIVPETLEQYINKSNTFDEVLEGYDILKKEYSISKCPVIIIGNGVSYKDASVYINFAETLNIPIITTLLAKGKIPFEHRLNYGIVGGAYGHRYANMIIAKKADLIISFGASLCKRQTGTNVELFAPEAKVIRFDIDSNELKKKISEDINVLIDTNIFAKTLIEKKNDWLFWKKTDNDWLTFCEEYKKFCNMFDDNQEERFPNKVINVFNDYIGENDIVTVDVGQHMMWVAQSYKNKKEKPILFSGGHGAMGYALPAAVGASIAHPEARIFAFCGDGSVQMNIQELQWIKRENLNITLIILNNKSLGLIVQQQDAYFEGLHFGATYPDYDGPDFTNIAKAYGIKADKVNSIEGLKAVLDDSITGPQVIEFVFDKYTKAYPKTELGREIYDQSPLLPREQFQKFCKKGCK